MIDGFTTFSHVIEPMTQQEFLTSYYGEHYCNIRGTPERFRHLLPWDKLNSILVQHRLDYPRLRLVKNGQTLSPTLYIEHVPERRGRHFSQVKAEQLEREIRNGAMLHLASVEEVYEPITYLANDFQAILESETFVNAHVGLKASKGFDTHWDGHDVFIIQVFGRKYWRIYGITEKYPLPVSPDEKRGNPTDSVWEGVVEDGDVLYIPRGCWHSAQGMEGPTLHLTVGVVNPTGLDFLSWIGSELRKIEDFRKDIPRFSDPRIKEQYIARLREKIIASLTPEELERYLISRPKRLGKTRKVGLP